MPEQHCKDFWNRIPEDEPVFTLVGRDKLAALTVQFWIDTAKRLGVNANKIACAKRHLMAIMNFQKDNPGRVKLPD